MYIYYLCIVALMALMVIIFPALLLTKVTTHKTNTLDQKYDGFEEMVKNLHL